MRFLSNRSSGKMGFALAAAAVARGHRATLVCGPVSLATPVGVSRLDVVTTREMLEALRQNIAAADALVMAAAPADWRPAHCSASKLKKSAMCPVLELAPNPDILLTLQPLKERRLFVGFAAETGDPLPEARRKLAAKGLDMIVANDVAASDAGFAVDTNRVVLVGRDDQPLALPLMSKLEVAHRIIEWLEAHLPQP